MEKTTSITKKTAQKNTNITLLQAIERVVELSRGSQLGKELFRKAKKELKLLADSYGITEQQAVFFCVCIEKGPRRVDFDDIARFLEIGKTRMLGFATDIDALVRRRILKYCDVKDEEDFDVPVAVMRCLKHNEVYQLPKRKGLNCHELFELIGMWADDLDNDAISPNEMYEELESLFEDNPQIGFVKQMKLLEKSFEHKNYHDVIMITLFCHYLVNESDDNIVLRQLECIFRDRPAVFTYVKTQLRGGTHNLMESNLIEHVCEDGIADTGRFRLTDQAKRNLLGEFNIATTEEHLAGVLKPSDLSEKTMFYPQQVENQVAELSALFQPEEYKKIHERMKQRGFRNGFACLFYGTPGTGKTETVYQLARRTGRAIMVVDVPQIKSKWVGDSEKNIKALFDRYRDMVKHSEITPILLFNEADGIIGIRYEGATRAVDKMENSIQNIILQEMETLDGIMIATTNLSENLDKAFERRFLYKIKFEKPDENSRRHIWQAMIPELCEADAAVLAQNYNLSGGQIENVARKHSINIILHGEKDNLLPTLSQYCSEEKLHGREHNHKLGF